MTIPRHLIDFNYNGRKRNSTDIPMLHFPVCIQKNGQLRNMRESLTENLLTFANNGFFCYQLAAIVTL